MAEPLLIGIDAGTSVIKAVAFTPDGKQVGAAALPNHYDMLPDGGAEQDMANTWADTARVLRMLGGQVQGLPSRALALAVTGQGDGTWLIDKNYEPVAMHALQLLRGISPHTRTMSPTLPAPEWA
jgi:erythritol kinase (D-erythritol 1-phosphate-forming)